jgi:NAD(P)-dependent dehydrogenase (short-subunit alcohol dehydrogenase family)
MPTGATTGLLAGKSAIVTGATRGIGRAIAIAFVEAGARHVIAVGRSKHALDDLAARSDAIEPLCADLALEKDVDGVVDAARRIEGGLDILVNNAGIGWSRRSSRLDANQLDEIYAINVRAATLLACAVATDMAERGGGSIINVTSITSIAGAPFSSAYAATKGALTALTRSLAAEWGPKGVRVNDLSPGVIDTDIWAGARNDDNLRRFIDQQVPLRRWGVPTDVTGPAVFLASDAAAYVTGHTLVVDGGMSRSIDLLIP